MLKTIKKYWRVSIMSNKEIIKSYEQICGVLKQNNSEENKQQYLILFKELEIQLNKSFNGKLEQLSYTAKNMREEIRRIDVILSLIKNRQEFRTRMIKDHRKYIGYDPLELDEIEIFDQVGDYESYKNNLVKANQIIVNLIRSGKKLKSLKSQLERNPKNADYLNVEISNLQKIRTEQIEELKKDADVLEDLYNYCLTAPFNEENAYIEYILIKLNPKSELKINLGMDNKRAIKNRKSQETIEVKKEMPELKSIGSVRPNNIFMRLEKASKEITDINIPTNGLIEQEESIKVNVNEL